LFDAVAPILWWAGIVEWWPIVATYAAVTLFIVTGIFQDRLGRAAIFVPLGLSVIALFTLSRVTSPFLIAPGIGGIFMSSFAAYPPLVDRQWIPLASVIAGFAIALVVELVGALPSTLAIGDGAITISNLATRAREPATEWFLVLALFATLIAAAGIARQMALDRREAQRDLEIRAWHLRQLVRR
jgi:hypothetical protein